MLSTLINRITSIRQKEPELVEHERPPGEDVVVPVGCAVGPCPPAQPQQLALEPVDGGLLVAGIPVASSCKFTLPISGCMLIFIGTLITVFGYGQPSPADTATVSWQRANWRVLGPALLSLGLLALLTGTLVCLLAHFARSSNKRVCFHCPIHGDFFPVIPVPISAVKPQEQSHMLCVGGRPPTGPPQAPPCPYSQLLTARSSVSSTASCPAPTPFVTDNSLRCAEYFWPLSASQDIASFPASRTPSPTPINL